MSSDPVPPAAWGRDHWSTFAYVETRIVDHKGVPDRRHMRCDPALHPQFAHEGSRMGTPSPTRLREGERQGHDDWSCLDDAEAAGLLRNAGTGLNRVYVLTDEGRRVADLLREHKRTGGRFATFSYPAPSP